MRPDDWSDVICVLLDLNAPAELVKTAEIADAQLADGLQWQYGDTCNHYRRLMVEHFRYV